MNLHSWLSYLSIYLSINLSWLPCAYCAVANEIGRAWLYYSRSSIEGLAGTKGGQPAAKSVSGWETRFWVDTTSPLTTCHTLIPPHSYLYLIGRKLPVRHTNIPPYRNSMHKTRHTSAKQMGLCPCARTHKHVPTTLYKMSQYTSYRILICIQY